MEFGKREDSATETGIRRTAGGEAEQLGGRCGGKLQRHFRGGRHHAAPQDAGSRRGIFRREEHHARRAAEKVGLNELDSVLEGSTALAVSAGDHVAAAKILCEYAEKNKSFEIKAGFVEGKVINKAEVEELAKMPPKEVLVAKVLAA